MMKHTKINLKSTIKTLFRVNAIIVKDILMLYQKLNPLLKLAWQNKIMLVSVVNATIAGALSIMLSIRFIALLKGNNYWWKIGEQSGISSDNGFDYIRSIAHNNIPAVFSALIFAGLLLTQTIRIVTKAKTEKWDKKGKGKWLKQISLIFYLILVITLTVVFIR